MAGIVKCESSKCNIIVKAKERGKKKGKEREELVKAASRMRGSWKGFPLAVTLTKKERKKKRKTFDMK